jgi:hypothetical protein
MQVRKILSRDEIEKRDRKKKVIISVILVAIMLFSSAGYAFFSNEETTTKIEKITYGGIEFTKTEYNTWQFTQGNYQFETKFTPEDTKNISSQTNKNLNNYYQKPLYFGINSNMDIASYGNIEILRNVYSINSIIERYDNSCLDENCTEDKPIKDCFVDNVIIFKESNESVIKTEDGCIVLYSPLYEQEKIADAFLFRILNI